MDRTTHGGGFHLTIDGLEEFAAFIALIRGEQDAAKIREMTRQLTASTTALSEAERADAAPPGEKTP